MYTKLDLESDLVRIMDEGIEQARGYYCEAVNPASRDDGFRYCIQGAILKIHGNDLGDYFRDTGEGVRARMDYHPYDFIRDLGFWDGLTASGVDPHLVVYANNAGYTFAEILEHLKDGDFDEGCYRLPDKRGI